MVNPQEYLAARNQAAAVFVQRIQEQIAEMEPHIDENHVVAIFIYTPAGEIFRIFDVGLRGPETIVFRGFDSEGNPVRIITHFQSVLLTVRVVAIAPADPPEARRPIGFNA